MLKLWWLSPLNQQFSGPIVSRAQCCSPECHWIKVCIIQNVNFKWTRPTTSRYIRRRYFQKPSIVVIWQRKIWHFVSSCYCRADRMQRTVKDTYRCLLRVVLSKVRPVPESSRSAPHTLACSPVRPIRAKVEPNALAVHLITQQQHTCHSSIWHQWHMRHTIVAHLLVSSARCTWEWLEGRWPQISLYHTWNHWRPVQYVVTNYIEWCWLRALAANLYLLCMAAFHTWLQPLTLGCFPL